MRTAWQKGVGWWKEEWNIISKCSRNNPSYPVCPFAVSLCHYSLHQAIELVFLLQSGLTLWFALTKRIHWKWHCVTPELGLKRYHNYHSFLLGSQPPYQGTRVRLLNDKKPGGQRKALWKRKQVPWICEWGHLGPSSCRDQNMEQKWAMPKFLTHTFA